MSGNDLFELLGIPAASDADKVEVRLNMRFLPTVEALIQRIKTDACPGLGDLSDQCCASLAALEEMVQEVDRLRAQIERVQGAHELTAAWDKASIVNALANIRDTDASAKTLREIAGRALSNSAPESDGWVSSFERAPTKSEADFSGQVIWWEAADDTLQEFRPVVAHYDPNWWDGGYFEDFSKDIAPSHPFWKRTGLKRPNPPEGMG